MWTLESRVYPYSQGAYVIEAQDQASSQDGVRSNYEISYLAMNYRDRHLEVDTLLNLFKHPALTERCAQLLGPDLLLWRTQFFPKPSGGAGTPLHQASCYLLDNMKAPVVYPPDPSELFQLTCWIALTNATQENGCMTVVKGSQRRIHPLKISRSFNTENDGGVSASELPKSRLTIQFSQRMSYPLKWQPDNFSSLVNERCTAHWATKQTNGDGRLTGALLGPIPVSIG